MGYLTYEDGGYIRTARPEMYLQYITYQRMGGTLDETTFEDLEYEAETIVNWYTFNRLKGEEKYPDELERCMYRIIHLLQLEYEALSLGKSASDDDENATSPEYIKSQSNDGVSASYSSVDASDLLDRLLNHDKNNPFMNAVFRYLQGVRNSKGKRLTYRGVYPDE